MNAGRWDEACPKFEQAMAKQPTASILVNVGDCHAHDGELAQALDDYAVARELNRDTRDEGRRAAINAEIDAREKALSPRVPRLRVVVENPVAGMVVRRNGEVIPDDTFGADVAVDPGAYEVTAEAPGHEAFAAEGGAREEGATERVTIRFDASSFAAHHTVASLAVAGGAVALAGAGAGLAGWTAATHASLGEVCVRAKEAACLGAQGDARAWAPSRRTSRSRRRGRRRSPRCSCSSWPSARARERCGWRSRGRARRSASPGESARGGDTLPRMSKHLPWTLGLALLCAVPACVLQTESVPAPSGWDEVDEGITYVDGYVGIGTLAPLLPAGGAGLREGEGVLRHRHGLHRRRTAPRPSRSSRPASRGSRCSRTAWCTSRTRPTAGTTSRWTGRPPSRTSTIAGVCTGLCTSDGRLKTNVEPVDGALDRLLQLRGVTFEWKDPEAHGERERGAQRGFIAQDVAAVFPEWVTDGPDGYKRLHVRGFEALAVEALRALHDRRTARSRPA